MNTILIVENLIKKYNTFTAVDGVSFSVLRGEIFGILGPNGAGKTTTLEIIEGIRDMTSGSITLDGLDILKHKDEVKRKIGVQLQSTGFFENLTLVELLKLFGSLYNLSVDPFFLLDQVELRDKAKSRVKTLSGGQQQRFSIALALANDPILLFLDEPTTGLDPQARRHMWELIKKIQAQGKTIVITTHNMEEAEELCHRVAIMDQGKILQLARPVQLIDDLIATGFKSNRVEKLATLEDVFITLTGKNLRD
jgi:ABC-2 type transport system ATP-binding protein